MMVPQQQFIPMPYYFPVVPMQQMPQQIPSMMMQPNQMGNGNFDINSSQNVSNNELQLNYGGEKKRAQSQSDIQFEDILDKEKFKFESAKNLNRKGDFFKDGQQLESNIFKMGNHNNHFNPKSMTEIVQDRYKKNQYAQLLQQQMKQKKELELEKKVLDTKHNLHLHLERQKNDVISYNMPIRDQYGNILQSRGQPGNRNYQMQDWFTHVPNINQKYVQEEDLSIVEQASNALKDSISNPHFRDFNAFQRQQQGLLSFENKYKRPLQFNFSNDKQKQQSLIFNNNLNYNNNGNYQENQQYSADNGQQYNNNYDNNIEDEDQDDDNRKVRILTPTKYRRTAKGTQTPHNPDELNQLSNQQIGDLYPSLSKSNHDVSERTSQQRLQTGYTRLPSSQSLLPLHPTSSVRFTQYLKGDYKYANDIDKMRKREQYINLQNDQISQMEEKKRQKELNNIQEKREKDLEDLRIMREQQILNEKYAQELSSLPNDKRNLRESYVPDTNNLRFSQRAKPSGSAFSNFEVNHVVSGKKGKRPRTPLEDAFNPFGDKMPVQSTSQSNQQVIIQEIPIKVKEQVGDVMNEELSKLRSELRVSQGFVQNELNNIKQNINVMNQQKMHQEQNQNLLYNEINKTRLVDEIRRREIEQKVKEKERSEQEQIDAELAESLLNNPGFARYDLQNQKKVFFDYDDQYEFNPNRINHDIGGILKQDELPSQKIIINYNHGGFNKANYLTYDDGFEKTTNEILNNQQMRIEQRLKNMGISNVELPKSPSTVFQNLSTAADNPSINNYNSQYLKSNQVTSLSEINKPNTANSDTDEIYNDLIKGNVENSKVFKNKRDNDKLDIEDFIMWNSKNARYK